MDHTHLLADHESFHASKVAQYLVAHPLVGLAVTVGVIAAYVCSEIAMAKGRNDRIWATLALLFVVAPLIVLIALPSIESTPSSAA